MASFVLPLFPLSLVITVTFYQIKLQLVIYNSFVFLFVKYNFNLNKSIYNNFCMDSISLSILKKSRKEILWKNRWNGARYAANPTNPPPFTMVKKPG